MIAFEPTSDSALITFSIASSSRRSNSSSASRHCRSHRGRRAGRRACGHRRACLPSPLAEAGRSASPCVVAATGRSPPATMQDGAATQRANPIARPRRRSPHCSIACATHSVLDIGADRFVQALLVWAEVIDRRRPSLRNKRLPSKVSRFSLTRRRITSETSGMCFDRRASQRSGQGRATIGTTRSHRCCRCVGLR